MNNFALYNPDVFKELKCIQDIRKTITPVTFESSVKNYAGITESIDRMVWDHAFELIRHTLDQADMAFRKKP